MSIVHRIINKVARELPKRTVVETAVNSLTRSSADYCPDYLDVCVAAVLNRQVFAGFRRDPGYTQMLEHVTESQGLEYWKLLSPSGRASQAMPEAAKNDLVGGPVTMRLDNGVVISPTTLRYLKVADDIERLLGTLDGANVVEIGIGYGGQCRVLDALFQLNSYTLVDLRPVLNLAEKFLSHFPLRCPVRFTTMNELAPQTFDFAVSNYAFSELPRVIQETYFAKCFQNTPRGYLTFNQVTSADYEPFTWEELCTRLQARSIPEVPLTHPNNRILVWGAAK